MISFATYMLKEAQTQVPDPVPPVPPVQPAPVQPPPVVPPVQSPAQPTSAAAPATFTPVPEVSDFFTNYLPSKPEDIVYKQAGKGKFSLPVPDNEATAKKYSDAFMTKMKGMSPWESYKYTRALQDYAKAAEKDPEHYKNYNLNLIQQSAYSSAVKHMGTANDQWKTHAMDQVKNYVKNNWQYILPALAGAGMIGWGMYNSRRQAPGARKPEWYENASWRRR